MTTPQEAPAPQDNAAPLSTAEVAYLIRVLWEALRAPKWSKQNRRDLEKLGEALYSGKSLKELDDALYEKILPHLKVAAESLGRSLQGSPPAPASASSVAQDAVDPPKEGE